MTSAVITVRDPSGRVLASVTRVGGRAVVAPPAAAAHPLVAAVAAELERSAARPRPRPSC